MISATVLLALCHGCTKRHRLDAAAEMVYDEFGNLKMRGERLTINGADGKPTASSSWKKSQ
jgi:hypothetical protein